VDVAPHYLAQGVPPRRPGRPLAITCSLRVLRRGWAWARPAPPPLSPHAILFIALAQGSTKGKAQERPETTK